MQIIPIPCLYDNYSYLVIDSKGQEAVVIDPCEAHPILVEAEKRGLYISAILCTHHHPDHLGGLEEMLEQLPDLDVYAYFSEDGRISEANKLVTDGDTLDIGDLQFKVIHTPGHTAGSVCYLINSYLFTGDTLFGGGVGRLTEGSAEQMYSSIEKLLHLPKSTKLYFGHEYTKTNLLFGRTIEPNNKVAQERLNSLEKNKFNDNLPSSIHLELETNPFLRCDQDEVIKGLQQKKVVTDSTPLEIFREIRLLRDVWKA